MIFAEGDARAQVTYISTDVTLEHKTRLTPPAATSTQQPQQQHCVLTDIFSQGGRLTPRVYLAHTNTYSHTVFENDITRLTQLEGVLENLKLEVKQCYQTGHFDRTLKNSNATF